MREAQARFARVIGGAFDVSRRDARWLALGDDVVAFAADDDLGWRQLQREAWLLRRWRAAGVPAPRVLREDATALVQVRERLHGLTGDAVESRLFVGERPDAWARLDHTPITRFGERLAGSYGELARRIKGAVTVDEAAAVGIGLCPRRAIDLDGAIARLHASTASAAARAAAERARPWLAALPPPDAVIHADLHFYNMCCAEDGSITGVFDLDGAGIDAAATELLYVYSLGRRFADVALDAYGPIDLDDVHRAHVRIALDHLNWHGPGTERHAAIVDWVTAVLERL